MPAAGSSYSSRSSGGGGHSGKVQTRGPTSSTRQHDTIDAQCETVTFHFRSHGGSVVLLDGTATIFSAPLTRNVRYNFSRCGVPVVVTSRARFDVEGDFAVVRGILDSAVEDIHAVLEVARATAVNAVEERRIRREEEERSPHMAAPEEDVYSGPRVMVVGDQNTGKSSLCRSLVNLAVAKGSGRYYGVTYIDTDIGQQCITCPGSIAAVFTEAPVPVDEGFNTMMPLSFFYGDKVVNPATRKRYLDLCACAAQASASVGYAKPQFECGGMIINTMGWTTELGRDLLLELLSIFSITHIVVTGSDLDLEVAMRNAAVGRSIEIIRYPKQAAIPKRGASVLSDTRSEQLISYFSGTPRTPLCPARGVAKVTDVTFLNALTLEPMSWRDVQPCSLGAVVWADNEETAGEANVAGYVVLLEIGKRNFSFLAPAAGELPKPFLLISSTLRLPPSKIPPIKV